MSVYYLDTSAAIKALAQEVHSEAFVAFRSARPDATWVSSTVMRLELLRAVMRVLPAAEARARALFGEVAFLAMDDTVIDAAAAEPNVALRSLDAIHLASARLLQDDLTAIVTYDRRLATAASEAGMCVESPGTN